MSLVRCADLAVLAGIVQLPLRGAWVAGLVLDGGTAPSGSVRLVADGGFDLTGFVVPTSVGVDKERVFCRLVGGAGGLGKMVAKTYQKAKLRDPINEIMAASGESLASSSSSDVLGIALDAWTLGETRAGRALNDVVAVASARLGVEINWRVLADGGIWIGAETWPTANLPAEAVVISTQPEQRVVTLGVATPALLPGVDLELVGKVREVHHRIDPREIRTIVRL